MHLWLPHLPLKRETQNDRLGDLRQERNIDGTSEWQDFWNIGLKQTTDFPEAVKINFVIEEKSVSLMVKIMSEYDVSRKG